MTLNERARLLNRAIKHGYTSSAFIDTLWFTPDLEQIDEDSLVELMQQEEANKHERET